jgi:GT2 family glycosyltransferase
MDLSVIIVSWNVRKLLKENLKAIYDNTQNINFEVFVVDNNSKDNTVEMVREKFPKVKLIVNDINEGFAKGNNQAIKKSSGKYILLLNPDMQVLPETLEKMVLWMDNNKKAGVAGCHLVKDSYKTVQHVRRFPRLFDQLMITLKVPHFFPGVLNKYLAKDFDYSTKAVVDSIRGSFFVIRREVIESVGLLDDRYFIWFEEVDYCRKVKDTHWDVVYTPEVKCIDHVGQSFSQVKTEKAQKYFRNSMLEYFKKWHPAWQYWTLKIAWPLGLIISKIKKEN